MDILTSSILGLIAGFSASWLFWKYLLNTKPRVEISDEIAVQFHAKTQTPIYTFKLVNRGLHQVTSIYFNAWLCELVDIPRGKVTHGLYKFPISNSDTRTLASKNSADPPWGLEAEMNIATRPEIDATAYLKRGDCAILITCKYTDAISGTTVVQQKHYNRHAIVPGWFPAGDSLKVERSDDIEANYRLN
ncbi:MAG: hypothetical protein PVG66_03160 [Chromatiales bacterium]